MSRLEKRLNFMRIFNKSAKLPETKEEFQEWADTISCDLSPENLSCDGECSASEQKARAKELFAEHKELEALAGYKLELVY